MFVDYPPINSWVLALIMSCSAGLYRLGGCTMALSVSSSNANGPLEPL